MMMKRIERVVVGIEGRKVGTEVVKATLVREMSEQVSQMMDSCWESLVAQAAA